MPADARKLVESEKLDKAISTEQGQEVQVAVGLAMLPHCLLLDGQRSRAAGTRQRRRIMGKVNKKDNKVCLSRPGLL